MIFRGEWADPARAYHEDTLAYERAQERLTGLVAAADRALAALARLDDLTRDHAVIARVATARSAALYAAAHFADTVAHDIAEGERAGAGDGS